MVCVVSMKKMRGMNGDAHVWWYIYRFQVIAMKTTAVKKRRQVSYLCTGSCQSSHLSGFGRVFLFTLMKRVEEMVEKREKVNKGRREEND